MGIGAALALCLAAQAASAQERPVTSRQDRGDTLKVNVSGHMTMDAVWRSSETTFMTEGFTSGGETSDGETSIEGRLGVRFDAELSDKISVVIEIGKERVDGTIDEFNGGSSEDVRLLEAHIMLNEFLRPGLKAQMGISTWNFDVRGKGRSFAFDPRHSQSVARNWRTGEDVLVAAAGTAAGWAERGDEPGTLYPVGVTLTYVKDNVTIDVVALPMVIEGGNPSEDEALYALDLWYNLDSAVSKGSRLGLIVAVNNIGPGLPTVPAGIGNHRTGVVTLGGGIVLNGLADGLEIYGEGYIQFGNAGQQVTAGEEDEVKAKGKAGQVGFEYRIPGNVNNMWLGANVTYVSGDGDDSANDNVDTFLGYENVRDLLILEDQYFGFDVDVNYTAFKISAGATFSVGQGKNNVDFMVIAGFARANEDVVISSTEGEDKLGNEFDATFVYHVNKQVNVHTAFAYLAGSDILEEAMGGGSSGSDASDKAMLATLGFDVKF
jgi:hypothetical protein